MYSMQFFLTGLLVLGLIALYAAKKKDEHFHFYNVVFILAAGLFVRFAAGALGLSHPTDIDCFRSWAILLNKDGFGAFYTLKDMHTDYPPAYMYVLWFIGGLKSTFDLEFDSYTYELLIKLPAILADLFAACFIYFIAVKEGAKRKEPTDSKLTDFAAYTPSLVALAYVLNPAAILDSAVWGQVDSVLALLVILSIYLLYTKKYLGASLVYVLAILTKPQALMFAPVYMYAFFMYLKRYRFSVIAFVQLILWFLSCAMLAALIVMPFAFTPEGFTFSPVIDQFTETLSQYAYTTVNAYNIYALFGLNWVSIETKFLFFTYDTWGLIFLVIIVAVSLLIMFKSKGRSRIFIGAAFINIATFMLSVKMHERYAFTALALLIISYVMSRDKRFLYLYWGFTLAFFMNYVDVLRVSLSGFDYSIIGTTARILAVPCVAMFGYLIYVVSLYVFPAKQVESTEETQIEETNDEERAFNPTPESTDLPKFIRADYITMLGITGIYAIIAFARLGNNFSPQTEMFLEQGRDVTVEFHEPVQITRIQYFLGARTDQKFVIEFQNDSLAENLSVEANGVFKWLDVYGDWKATRVRLSARTNDLRIMEMAFRDPNGQIIPIKEVTPFGANGFDEQNLVVEMSTFDNTTYFDEIYHPRTAYEFINKMYVYEWTHPPLGKVIMSWGVRAFGMTPFGWRFTGTLFGVLMLPLMYVFARVIFGKRMYATFATVLFAADFMHFAQTRIATIDSYITFFVMAMYLCMFIYMRMSFFKQKFWKTLIPLGLSGLFMGLGVASKWPGVYAGLGLAVIFFVTLIRRYKEHVNADGNTKFWKYTALTCLWCLLFFIAVPLVIFVLSYIPYYATGSLYPVRENIRILKDSGLAAALLPDNALGNYLAAILQNQLDMFNYHAGVTEPHPYGAPWYLWPLTIRPIFYYSATFSDTIRAGISSFGNPVIWWGGFVALIHGVYKLAKKWSWTLFFLIVAWVAQFLPWVFVSRTTYIYHYFPCVPFVILLLTKFFNDREGLSNNTKHMLIIMVVSCVLFVMFYPVLSGLPVDFTIAKRFLEWLPGKWQLI